MNNKQARRLWEDALIHGPKGKAFEALNITKENAKIFMTYTMPEMFVSDETTRISLLKIKELTKIEKKLFSTLKKKQSSEMLLTIGLFLYSTLVLPFLALILYSKYIA